MIPLCAPLLLALMSPIGAYELDEIPVTRWPEPFRPAPLDPAAVPVPMPEEPLLVRTIEAREPPVGTPGAGLQGRVLVLVESGLLGPLDSALDTFLDDLTLEGHPVLLESAEDGSGDDLKAHLQELYAEDAGLEGAILVGELPLLRYEFVNDYGHYGYAVFPCELALADLDGTWTDSNDNGIYDGHGRADAAPEIWVGRMIARDFLGERVGLLTDYFDRDHAFRRGEIEPVGSSLVYVDDDWAHWAAEYQREIEGGFPEVTRVSDADVTRKADYVPRLTQDYDNIAVFVHSSPMEHYFVYRGSYDEMYWEEVPDDATALFYDLFACSNSDFDQDSTLGTGSPVFMGGVYTFGTEFGLLSLGSTKTGSMLERPYYYDRLGEHESFGAALQGWWEDVQPYEENLRENWYYGMTQIGDPSLRIAYPTVGADLEEIVIDQDEATPVSVDLSLTNTGVGTYHWGLALAQVALESQPWIQASEREGAVGGRAVTVRLTFDPALAGGVDPTQTLLIRAPGATNNPVAIPLQIRHWGPAALYADPDPIEVALDGPSDRAVATIAIGNCNPGPVSWTAEVSDTWMRLDTAAGEAADGPDAVSLVFSGHGLARDSGHEGFLTLSATEEGVTPVRIPVSLTVGADGCGCSSGGARGGWAGLLLLGLAPLIRRERQRERGRGA